jgi:hypothetical protein
MTGEKAGRRPARRGGGAGQGCLVRLVLWPTALRRTWPCGPQRRTYWRREPQRQATTSAVGPSAIGKPRISLIDARDASPPPRSAAGRQLGTSSAGLEQPIDGDGPLRTLRAVVSPLGSAAGRHLGVSFRQPGSARGRDSPGTPESCGVSPRGSAAGRCWATGS